MSRNRLIGILTLACLAGYVWIYLNLSGHYIDRAHHVSVCLFKKITNIPCPSCGSTRSVVSIIKGEYLQGLYINPFGFILLLIMTITPFWICYDYLKQKNTLLQVYTKVETIINQKIIAIPAILLVLANWLWNIQKGL